MAEWKFYEDVVRRHEKDETIKITKLEIQDACEKGNNFVSTVQRISINGVKSTGDYRRSLIAKTISETAWAKKFNFDVFFKNEINVYKYILPALKAHSKHTFNIPSCCYVDQSVIVLNDLLELGCSQVKKGQRFTVDQCQLVLKELAKLHAASLSLQEREPPLVSTFKDLVKDIMNPADNVLTGEELTKQITILIKLYSTPEPNTENQTILNRLESIKLTLNEDIWKTLTKPRKIRVFNHGDSWGNNIFFKNEDVYLVDLQMMRFTSVAADLSYFLYINTTVELRRTNWDKLLSVYLQYLKFYCTENDVSVDVVKELTMDWLVSEMKEFALFGFICAIWIMPIFYFKMEDLDANQQGTEYSVDDLFDKMSDDYKKALREYVTEYVKYS